MVHLLKHRSDGSLLRGMKEENPELLATALRRLSDAIDLQEMDGKDASNLERAKKELETCLEAQSQIDEFCKEDQNLLPITYRSLTEVLGEFTQNQNSKKMSGLLLAWSNIFGERKAWQKPLEYSFLHFSKAFEEPALAEIHYTKAMQSLRELLGVHPDEALPLSFIAQAILLDQLEKSGVQEELLLKLKAIPQNSDAFFRASKAFVSDPIALAFPVAGAMLGSRMISGTAATWMRRAGYSDEIISGAVGLWGFIGETMGFVQGSQALNDLRGQDISSDTLGDHAHSAGFIVIQRLAGVFARGLTEFLPRSQAGQLTSSIVHETASVSGLVVASPALAIFASDEGAEHLEGPYAWMHAIMMHFGMKAMHYEPAGEKGNPRGSSESFSWPNRISKKIMSFFESLSKDYDSALAGPPTSRSSGSGGFRGELKNVLTVSMDSLKPLSQGKRIPGKKLSSAKNSGSSIRSHLEAHVDPADIGSKFHFGRGEVFYDAESLINFSEAFLELAYHGQISSSDEIDISIGTGRRAIKGKIRLMTTGEVIDGVDVGVSEVGKRVVIRVELDRSIGENRIVERENDQDFLSIERQSGGRKENVTLVNGKGNPTNVFYIMGGSYGPTDTFGLYTLFSGRYAPPSSDVEYWSRHAFVTGQEGSFVRVDGEGVFVPTESYLNELLSEGPDGSRIKINEAYFQDPVDKTGSHPKKIDLVKWAESLLRTSLVFEAYVRDVKELVLEVKRARSSYENLFGKLRELSQKVHNVRRERSKATKEFFESSNAIDPAVKAQLETLRSLKMLQEEELIFVREAMRDPYMKEKIIQGIRTADGLLRKGKAVPAYTTIRGVIFEISRYLFVSKSLGVSSPLKDYSEAKTQIEYLGIDKNGNPQKMKSEIDQDVSLLTGHIWDTKRYPRMEYGTERTAKNQILKYQAALEQGAFHAATIEIHGRVNAEFLKFAEEHAPDVEVLYVLDLPGSHEIIFPIKESRSGRPSLRRIQPKVEDVERDLSGEQQLILKGLQKAIEQGRVQELFTSDLLSVEDVVGTRFETELLEAELNPRRIKDVAVMKAYEKLVGKKRHDILIAFAEGKNQRVFERSNLVEVTDGLIEQEIMSFDYHIAHNEPASFAERLQLTPEQKDKVRVEYAKRRKVIAEYENQRKHIEDVDANLYAERRALGYEGPEGGYPLIPYHIYFDVLKAVLKEGKVPGRADGLKPRKERVPWKRTYDLSELYPRAEKVLADIRAGEYSDEQTHAVVRYPKGYLEEAAVVREFEISNPKAKEKFYERDVLNPNLNVLEGLSSRADLPDSIRRGIEQFGASVIGRAKDKLESVISERDLAIASVPNKEKGQVAQTYVKTIFRAKEELIDAYREVLGEETFNQLTIRVLTEKTDRIKKFIYVVDAHNNIVLYEESIEPGYERPAHSYLSGGRNIYGGGEVYVIGDKILRINNGSGHYQPDAVDNLSYVKKLFERVGFDTSEARLEHVLHPFISIDTPLSSLWQNNLFCSMPVSPLAIEPINTSVQPDMTLEAGLLLYTLPSEASGGE